MVRPPGGFGWAAESDLRAFAKGGGLAARNANPRGPQPGGSLPYPGAFGPPVWLEVWLEVLRLRATDIGVALAASFTQLPWRGTGKADFAADVIAPLLSLRLACQPGSA
jgi:hypothetical protein